MSRRSKRRNATEIDTTDDLLEETLAPRRVQPPAIVNRPPRTAVGLSDLRRWDPAPQVAREATGRPARIVHKVAAPGPKQVRRNAYRPHQSPSAFGVSNRASFRFETGANIPICVRRKTRKEVLHALKKTNPGKGSKKHRNQWSSIKCGMR